MATATALHPSQLVIYYNIVTVKLYHTLLKKGSSDSSMVNENSIKIKNEHCFAPLSPSRTFVTRIKRKTMETLTKFVGKVSEVQLTYRNKIDKEKRIKVHDPETASSLFREFLGDQVEYSEAFYACFLNRDNDVLSVNMISKGGISSTVVDVRIIIQHALLLHASSIIIGHNHPSGNLKASGPDMNITKRIREACNLFDIKLLDSLIITKDHFSHVN